MVTALRACSLFVPSVLAAAAWAADGALVYIDITGTAGIGFDTLLTESLAWGDYDGDDDEDLYLTMDGANVLMRNDGGGNFTDVTGVALVGNTLFSVGCAFGDLDNDGDLDLYVVNFGSGPDALYRNNGDGTFTDVATIAGVTDESSSRGIAFADIDRDGLLDIYINAIGPDILYHNQGSLQFTNIAADADVGVSVNSGQGVGVVSTDVDGDGLPDFFTGNRSMDTNWLFHNTSVGGVPSFDALGAGAGLTQTGLGMGVLSLDYDNDLDFDLYWTCWPAVANAFYENIDGTSFTDVAVATLTHDPLGWGISCNAADVDNDGFEEFFVTNGFNDGTAPSVLFHNQGTGQFADASGALQGGQVFDGRGVAFADIDNDGDMDLCVTTDVGEPNRLWRNDTSTTTSWIAFRLRGTCSNRSAIGARITLEWVTPAGSQFTMKEVSGGAGRGSFNSLPVEFGHTGTGVIEATILWPSGTTQVIDGSRLAMSAYNAIVEPVVAGLPACDGLCIGDTDADRDTDVFDFGTFAANFGGVVPPGTLGDLDGDGDVDVIDFGLFAAHFGCVP